LGAAVTAGDESPVGAVQMTLISERAISARPSLRARQSVVMATRVTPEVYHAIRTIQDKNKKDVDKETKKKNGRIKKKKDKVSCTYELEVSYDPVARICTLAGGGAAPRQGLTLVHVRAQLGHIRDTFLGQVGLRGHKVSSI
jgi:hypothetical protein